MKKKLEQLNQKIESTRASLNKLVSEKGGIMTDDTVLGLSEELDDLIVQPTRCKISLEK